MNYFCLSGGNTFQGHQYDGQQGYGSDRGRGYYHGYGRGGFRGRGGHPGMGRGFEEGPRGPWMGEDYKMYLLMLLNPTICPH